MTQAVISIGAGAAQRPLIEAAQSLGYMVVGVDRAGSADCVASLDHHVQLSTYDPDPVIEAVRALHRDVEIVAVLARTSGPALATAARVAEALAVPGFPVAFADAAVEKSVLRYEAAQVGVLTPQGLVLDTCVLPSFDGPWVVKPDAPVVGKMNVHLVQEASGFEAAFAAAQSESLNQLVAVERFIPGADVGYMAVMDQGRVAIDFFYDEFVAFPHNRAVGLGVGGPSMFCTTRIEAQIRTAAAGLLQRWRMQAGFAFFSFRVDAQGGVFLYEVNPGLCGDGIADQLLSRVWLGFDPFAVEVAAVCGRGLDVHVPTSQGWCILSGEPHRFDDVMGELALLAEAPDGQRVAQDVRHVYQHVGVTS